MASQGYSQVSFLQLDWEYPKDNPFEAAKCWCGDPNCTSQTQCPCTVSGPNGVAVRCSNRSAHRPPKVWTLEHRPITSAGVIRYELANHLFTTYSLKTRKFEQKLRNEWCPALAEWAFCEEHVKEMRNPISTGLDRLWMDVQRWQQTMAQRDRDQRQSAQQALMEAKTKEDEKSLRTPPATPKERTTGRWV